MAKNIATTICTLVAGLLLSPAVEASFMNNYTPSRPISEVKLSQKRPASPIRKIHTRNNLAGGIYNLTDATVNTKTGEVFDIRRRTFGANNTLYRETVVRFHDRKVIYQALDSNGDGSWDYEEEKDHDARGRIILNKAYEGGILVRTMTLRYSPKVDTSTITDHKKKRTSTTKHHKDKNGKVVRQDIDFDNDGVVDMRVYR